ncbi:unnamed protein product [Phytophthora fragariaefolia]|uniref:Unnamed protein product n=1 Tax=Phytophthora fragariaefolia TaxID=1490495 RepID=A0A9W6XXC9_9STRA|nr:unnamed protein product [Phytophthora fragariaefolia]
MPTLDAYSRASALLQCSDNLPLNSSIGRVWCDGWCTTSPSLGSFWCGAHGSRAAALLATHYAETPKLAPQPQIPRLSLREPVAPVAMASTSSSAAVAAMVQRASQQYLECRRGVTAKVDEVKLLDEQIAAVFAQISALSEAPEGQEELSEEAKTAAKSVGRLEVTLAGVEGEEPAPNATITVALDPEYEADEYETVEEVVEKKDVVVTDEHGHVVEDGQVPEEDGENTPRKLKTTTKITRTVIKKRVKKEKAPVVRTVAWTAVAKSEEAEESDDAALTFPATFVFDPVQSREAVVTITVAAASESTEEDDEEPEPIKEIEFPISSLFQGNALDKWYTTAEEEEEEEPTTITELVEEAVKEAIEEEVAAEKADEAEKNEEVEEAEKTEEVEEAEKTEEVEETEEAEEAEKTEETEKTEEAEKTEEVEKSEEAEEAENTEKAEEAEKTQEAEQVQEEVKPAGSRFHVKANFVLSEAEKLSISVVALSKKKQEAEAALLVLEREAASLRTKYERLNASQRQLNASSISKPKSNLLGGRFGAGAIPVQRKSWYQSSRERANAFITKHQQVLVSVAMFTGSVCLFHFNGENLLA